jgi:hypothetical protein
MSRVRLDFHRDLDDPSLHFLLWKKGGFRRLSPPAVGELSSFEAPPPLGSFSP